MPRLPSIPRYLEQKILYRWMHGESPQEILDWIETSNEARRVPVNTSRSSVERVIKRLSHGESVLAGAAACRRLRCLAPTLVEKYETLTAAYEKCVADADFLDSDESKMRHQEKIRALKGLDVTLGRQLRLAGCTGSAADRVLQRAEAMEAQDLKELGRLKDALRAENAKPLAEKAAQHPEMAPERIEDMVLGDDFADVDEDICVEREDGPPAGPAVGPVARPVGPCLETVAREDPTLLGGATAGTAVPQLEDIAASDVSGGPAAPAGSASHSGGHFPVSGDGSAAEQGEMNRGTSGADPGSRGQKVPGVRSPRRPPGTRR